MNISIAGKRVIHSYHHYLMKLNCDEFHRVNCKGFRFREATEQDIEILKNGYFSVANMTKYLRKEKKYSTGLIFFEEESEKPVGYIWVVRRGGNEMSYRVRNIDGVLSCVCVFNDFRGRNIANLMICAIIELLKTEGCNNVALGVNRDNTAAIRAYTKAGFRIIGEKKYIRVLRKNLPYYKI